MLKNDTILITGANGFIGSNLFNRLKKEGFTNLLTPTKNDVNFLYQYDTDVYFWENQPKYVFHCAAIVGGIQANIDNPYKFLYENIEIQNHLIKASLDNDIKKFLFLGSSCIYPTNIAIPFSEEQLLSGPVEKTNEGYAIAKIAGLKMCEYLNKSQSKTKFCMIMPPNAYGPRDHFNTENSHVISSLITKFCSNPKSIEIWGSGKQRREFIYVDDLVDGMLWVMKNIDRTYQFLNIGTNVDYSIREIVEMITKITKYEGMIYYNPSKPEGMKSKLIDSTKINKIGWKSKTSMKVGLRKTISWYKKYLSKGD